MAHARPLRPRDLSPGNADDVFAPEGLNNLSNQTRADAHVHAGSAHCRSRPGDRGSTKQGPRSHILPLTSPRVREYQCWTERSS